MLVRRRLPRNPVKQSIPWMATAGPGRRCHVASTPSVPWSLRPVVGIDPTGHNCRLSTAAVGALLPRQHGLDDGMTLVDSRRYVGRARFVSGSSRRAAAAKVKLAHGARTETPTIPSFIEIRELATLLRVKPRALFKSLGGYQEKKKHRVVFGGVPYAFPNLGNVIVPFQDAQAVAKVLGKEIRFLDIDKKPRRAALAAAPAAASETLSLWEEGRRDGQGRRPVVVLLGHFNHGKTTILDALLGPSSGIAEREAGGITQEIRARTVSLAGAPETGDDNQAGCDEAVEAADFSKDAPLPSSQKLSPTVATFLDTPGQEIFYRMRTNGAKVADAVVLVVSAVDGVCLQTSESIGCAEELGLPAVVVLNKIDLLPEGEAAQKIEELSAEVREFVAIEDAAVIPISAHTGYGLDSLRTTLAAALVQHPTLAPTPPERQPGAEASEGFGSESGAAAESLSASQVPGAEGGAGDAVAGSQDDALSAVGGAPRGEFEVVMADAPEGAAMATVLDYTSSAKTGKVLLVLVDRGILRPGDAFVSGMLWGFVRSIYDEEGDKLLEHAGPGVAAKVVVVARTRVSNAPLGEPFRVLTKEAAEKVASVRALACTIDDYVDHYRLERDFPHLLDSGDDGGSDGIADGVVQTGDEQQEPPRPPRQQLEQPVDQPAGRMDDGAAGLVGVSSAAREAVAADPFERRQQHGVSGEEEEYLAPEDMPVTIVVKADSANTLASVLDALGDWGDVQSLEERPGERSAEAIRPNGEKHSVEFCAAESARGCDEEGPQQPRQEWGEGDLQHKQRRRLVVSVARSGVGAVTSSDVRLARDCECPVFAHNVRADAAAARELKRVGGAVVSAMPEGAVVGGEVDQAGVGVGGQDGFIGRAGEGRECIVVSETVGELLGEIERFVLRVR